MSAPDVSPTLRQRLAAAAGAFLDSAPEILVRALLLGIVAAIVWHVFKETFL